MCSLLVAWCMLMYFARRLARRYSCGLQVGCSGAPLASLFIAQPHETFQRQNNSIAIAPPPSFRTSFTHSRSASLHLSLSRTEQLYTYQS